MASSSTVARAFPPPGASILHRAVLTAHPGGKKAHPTRRTGPIGARQLDRFPSVGLHPAGLFSACPQRFATGRTLGTLLLRHPAPILSLTHLGQILDQLCSQLVDPFIHGGFNLGPRRFRVRFAPLPQLQHILQSCAHLLHLLTPLSFILLCLHPLAPLSCCFPLNASTPNLRN